MSGAYGQSRKVIIRRLRNHRYARRSRCERHLRARTNKFSKPLSQKEKFSGGVSIGAAYAKLPGEVTPDLNANMTWKNDADPFGIIDERQQQWPPDVRRHLQHAAREERSGRRRRRQRRRGDADGADLRRRCLDPGLFAQLQPGEKPDRGLRCDQLAHLGARSTVTARKSRKRSMSAAGSII
ncbi:MAG: TonB-dependent receptor [Massilia sp.]|nr:TonB-dependent receptor [Massilia sp.]